MATTNYNFTEIVGTNKINLVTDINTPLQEIDTALKGVADDIPTDYVTTTDLTNLTSRVSTLESTSTAYETRIAALESKLASITGTLELGSTYADIDTNGFVYNKLATE